jgi:hypothetical protein
MPSKLELIVKAVLKLIPTMVIPFVFLDFDTYKYELEYGN